MLLSFENRSEFAILSIIVLSGFFFWWRVRHIVAHGTLDYVERDSLGRSRVIHFRGEAPFVLPPGAHVRGAPESIEPGTRIEIVAWGFKFYQVAELPE